jgi:hypothetical protein
VTLVSLIICGSNQANESEEEDDEEDEDEAEEDERIGATSSSTCVY